VGVVDSVSFSPGIVAIRGAALVALGDGMGTGAAGAGMATWIDSADWVVLGTTIA